MADLNEQFEQASRAAKLRREAPAQAQSREAIDRLDALYRAAMQGDPSGRDAAMRQYIELVGDLGQQGG
jgi:DNA-binding FadR family transcriptional regulator